MNTCSPAGDTTLCITAGGRPQLLDRTLRSLLDAEPHFAHAIVANDAGDRATDQVVRRHLPHAALLSHPERKGHLASVDEMYDLVRTPYIFHCEDDWEFDPAPFLSDARRVLDSDPTISVVCVRQSGCLVTSRDGINILTTPEKLRAERAGNALFVKLPLSTRYSSFTFNPSLLRADLWHEVGRYRRNVTDTEWTINQRLAAMGRRTAHLIPGVCFHIGQGSHVEDPTVELPAVEPPSLLVRAVRKLGRAMVAFGDDR